MILITGSCLVDNMIVNSVQSCLVLPCMCWKWDEFSDRTLTQIVIFRTHTGGGGGGASGSGDSDKKEKAQKGGTAVKVEEIPSSLLVLQHFL